LWFNPNEPDKLCVFKNDQWEKIPDDEMQWSDRQKNIMQIANYKQQLAELETQFWFNGLKAQDYMVRFDAIKKRINELEQLDD
jgi:hypothetical protein